MTTLPVWVLGAAGQARETADLIATIGQDPRGRRLQVAGLLDLAEEERLVEAEGAVALGLGFPTAREATYQRWCDRFEVLTLVHPHANVGGGCVLDSGVVISAGCVVTTGVRLGAGSLLNPRSGVGHDTVLGRCCVVNPGANVSGSVVLGDRVLVGSGATILQGLTVGSGAVVGAGAVVTHDVPPDTTVVGVPARPVRKDG